MKWIVFEGMDGAGKTTQIELARKALEAEGKNVKVVISPGGWSRGQEFRDLVFRQGDWTPGEGDRYWHPLAKRFLFAADFVQSFHEVIAPLQDTDTIILMDRVCYISDMIYGWAEGVSEDKLKLLYEAMKPPVLPDLVLFLYVETLLSEVRLRHRADKNEMDLVDSDFKRKVRDGYLKWYDKDDEHKKEYIYGGDKIENIHYLIMSLIKEVGK